MRARQPVYLGSSAKTQQLRYAGIVASKSRHPEVQAKATLPAVRGIDLLHARYAVGEHLRASAQVDAKQVESWVRATSETLQRVFGEDTAAQAFTSMEAPEVGDDAADADRTRFLLEARLAMLEGLILRAEELYAEPLATIRAAPRRVFLAPGSDQTMAQAVVEFLESIECSPIVSGRAGEPDSAIEALDRHPDVGFAIVLLTGDAGTGAPNDGLLELGFLLGKLGRGRVCVVQSDALAAPRYDESVLRVELDDHGEWQDRLVKALRDGGIT
jgi:predicted nucleotide-binding protein